MNEEKNNIESRAKIFIKKNIGYIIGAGPGAVAGYLYWHYIGCESGTCPITSSPINSTIYGAMLGSLTGGMFKRKRDEKNI